MKSRTLIILFTISVIAMLSMAAQDQTFTTIHNFTGGTDGSLPSAGVTIRSGDLYGTSSAGGTFAGVVYQAKRVGSDWSVFPISYVAISGNAPDSRAIFGPDGHLYSTTVAGGPLQQGNVFDLTPPATLCRAAFCPWRETELHNFSGPDGANPTTGDLVWDQQGNIYGVTSAGGQFGFGAVYEMMRSQNGWSVVTLYSFAGGSDGSTPTSGVVMDGNGNLFGTTSHGGPNNYGTVFELKNLPGVGWTKTTVYNFQGTSDGRYPYGGVIFDGSGNLYGSTLLWGAQQGGTVFELSPSGDTWNFNLIYSLYGTGGPEASLTMDAAGNIYGGTEGDGSHIEGNVFELTKTGNGWTYTSLHDFSIGDGEEVIGAVAIDSDGTLYGTTHGGGLYLKGTLWMIKR